MSSRLSVYATRVGVGIAFVMMAILFFAFHARAAVGKIQLNVRDETRVGIAGAQIEAMCPDSPAWQIIGQTDGSGRLEADPPNDGACISGSEIAFRVSSSTFPTQVWPILQYAPAFYLDIDPLNSGTYHDGSTNVYTFGVEITGSYDIGFWNMEGDPTLQDFPSRDPDAVSVTTTVNVMWDSDTSPFAGINNDEWDVKFTKTVTTSLGWYRFVGSSDDGFRVYVDGVQVLMRDDNGNDSWQLQGFGTLYAGNAYLSAGLHTIVYEYYENVGGAQIQATFYPFNDDVPPPEDVSLTGEGTEEIPYLVGTCGQLQNINNYNSAAYFKLENDIDCTGVDFTPLNWEMGFSGVFDGNHKTISHLSIYNTDISAGLFSWGYDAVFKNVTLSDGVVGGNSWVGALVGEAYDIDIQNVTSTLDVSSISGQNIGGVVGFVGMEDGEMHEWSGIFASSSISGVSNVGGVAGYVELSGSGTSLVVASSSYVGSINAVIDALNTAGGIIGYVSNISGGEAASNFLLTHTTASSSIACVNGFLCGGLVGSIEASGNEGATITNVISSAVYGSVYTNFGASGGLVGGAYIFDSGSDVSITLASTTAHVDVSSGNGQVGGVLGYANIFGFGNPVQLSIHIADNEVFGNISGGDGVGGLVGGTQADGPGVFLQDLNTGGLSIDQNFFSGTVVGTGDYVGGIAGFLFCSSSSASNPFSCTVQESYVEGNLDGSSNNVGGIVGGAYPMVLINNNYANTVVSAASGVGGLVGYLDGESGIENSYAIGEVNSLDANGGGLVGIANSGSIEHSFAASRVMNGGGIYGSAASIFLNEVFFDASSTGQIACSDMGGIAGCNAVDTEEDPNISYFFNTTSTPPLDAWNFDNVWLAGESYPTLRRVAGQEIQVILEGLGTEMSPYLITSCAELQSVDRYASDGYYQLQNDIDCSETDFQPLQWIEDAFRGTFDGQGHTITNLTISQDAENVGLFKYVDGAFIEDVIFQGGSVAGTNGVGALAGSLYNSDIQRVTSTVEVATNDNGSQIGGLVGFVEYDNGESHAWTSLFVSTTVVGFDQTGGIAGYISVDDEGTSFAVTSAASQGNIFYTSEDSMSRSGGLLGEVNIQNTGIATSSFFIANSSASSTVVAGDGMSVGGFIGLLSANNEGDTELNIGPVNVVISSSTAQGSLEGGTFATGGFIGDLSVSGNASANVNIHHSTSSVNVNAMGNFTGGFVGWAVALNWYSHDVRLTLADDVSTGNVMGGEGTGGFLGSTEGMGPFVALFGTDSTGGLVIERSYATGNVTSLDNEVGGFIGMLKCLSYNVSQPAACEVSQNFSTGNVTGGGNEGAGYNVGGFVGGAFGSSHISDSYASGTVTEINGKHAGGFVGQVGNEDSAVNSIERCYASGAVEGANSTTGGFVGLFADPSGFIADSFSVGEVIANGEFTVGGFLGSLLGDPSFITNNYFDVTRSGQNNCTAIEDSVSGCTGVNIEGDSTNYFFNNAVNGPLSEWDFGSVWLHHASNFPTLRNVSGQLAGDEENGMVVGGGIEDDPYIISNCTQLQNINNDLSGYYVLQNDIDCSETVGWNEGGGFQPLGGFNESGFFDGFFDGKHHAISHLTINTSLDNPFSGLFGVVFQGVIQNVTLSQATITSSVTGGFEGVPFGVGTLVGIGVQPVLRGISIDNSYISASSTAGGLIGLIYNQADPLDQLYTESNISFSSVNSSVIESSGNNSIAGGIVGVSFGGNIDNVFSSSTVSAGSVAGGIGGIFGFGVLRNVYAAGNVLAHDLLDEGGFFPSSGAGGLVGFGAPSEVSQSFSSVVLQGEAQNVGAVVGGASDIVNYSYDYYDSGINNDQFTCGGDSEISAEDCSAVNVAQVAPEWFKNNAVVAPFVIDGSPAWDFDLVWNVTNDYPSLRNFVPPPHAPENLVVTGDFYENTSISWSAPSSTSEGEIAGYTLEYKIDNDNWNSAETVHVSSSVFSYAIPPATLSMATTYNFRVRAFQNGPEGEPLNGLATGVVNLTTSDVHSDELPEVTTNEVSDITQTSVTFNSMVVRPDGTALISEGFDYGESTDYGLGVGTIFPEAGAYSVTLGESALNCGTLYHYRAKAANENGESYGEDRTFITSACDEESPDSDPPVISSVQATALDMNMVNILWTTNESATSRVVYSLDESYVSSTEVMDNVLEHSVILSDLSECSLYHYRVVSSDVDNNIATSTEAQFITTGCAGNVVPTSATSSIVNVETGGSETMVDGSNAITVTLPPYFTDLSTQAILQIKSLNANEIMENVGKPGGNFNSGGSVFFDIKVFTDSQNIISSFGLPVTVRYHYNSRDVVGIDESSLVTYHYHDNEWLPLHECVVDTDNRTVTCTSSNFSIFGIFGQTPLPSVGMVNNYSAGGGNSIVYGCTDKLASNYNPEATVNIQCQYANTFSTTSSPVLIPVRVVSPTNTAACVLPNYLKNSVSYGAKNNSTDVKLLQSYLNNYEGMKLPIDGVYSKNLQSAVAKWQEKYTDEILKPFGLTKGTGNIATQSLKKIKQVYEAQCPLAVTPKKIAVQKYIFTRNLKVGDTGEDVRELQIFLNNHGYSIATSGSGSKGKESINFGPATVRAVIKFQEANAKVILNPYGLKKGTGIFGETTRKSVNEI